MGGGWMEGEEEEEEEEEGLGSGGLWQLIF